MNEAPKSQQPTRGRKIIRLFKREPDVYIGGKANPYMKRWHLMPRNRFFNIYLHHFLRSDEDRALHDHPWWSIGMILKGSYIEHMPHYPHWWRTHGDRITISKIRRAWRPVFRAAEDIHRIELFKFGHFNTLEKPVWTIFITGPKVRDWGFWCPFGFRIWNEFVTDRHVNGTNESTIGRGCE